MNPTQTGIAVALALTVVILFFILPGLFFNISQPIQDEQTISLPAGSQEQTTLNAMPIENITELIAADEVVGTGATAEAGDSVTVNYVGALTNGQVFDASANHSTEGFTFNLGAGQVIRGWEEGIVGMKEGGTRRLIIPPAYAYGDRGVGGVIPPNATLVFQVELLKVEKP